MTESRTRLTCNRVGGIVLACLVSYMVAHFMVMDIACVPVGRAAVPLGQIIALACLPVLIVLGFSTSAGLISVCAGGGLAALAGLLVS